jgi:hypothetical protein
MKKLLYFSTILAVLTSCGSSNNGELTGVAGRKKYFEPEPYGMVFIPQGSFNLGPSDQDVAWAQNTLSKTVTLDAFGWMKLKLLIMNTVNSYIGFVTLS